jgi:hypothetical protein
MLARASTRGRRTIAIAACKARRKKDGSKTESPREKHYSSRKEVAKSFDIECCAEKFLFMLTENDRSVARRVYGYRDNRDRLGRVQLEQKS